jgi:hypothetical protein
MPEQENASAELEGDLLAPPPLIVLGDAATLTRGGTHQSVEAKQTPYD